MGFCEILARFARKIREDFKISLASCLDFAEMQKFKRRLERNCNARLDSVRELSLKF